MQDTVNNTHPAIFAREFDGRSLDIIALSQVCLPEEGCRKEVKYTFYWRDKSGEARRDSGVGFAFIFELVHRLEEIHRCVSDGIIVLRLPLRNGRCSSLISVYALTLDSSDEDVEL